MKIRQMVLTAFFAAVISILAPLPISIPAIFGPVPLSLATFAIYVAASTLGWKYGVSSVLIYILIGTAGVPVFSNFGAGLPRLLGPTGGFILGYIPCALVTGLLVDRFEGKKAIFPAAMALATVALYVCGTVWYMLVTQTPLLPALSACVLPFLPGDAAKIVLASVVAPQLRRALRSARA